MAESRFPVGSSAKITVGLRHERAGDGDTLLLAARELRGPVGSPVVEAGALDDLVDPLLVDLAAGELEREPDVLLCVQHREEVEELEDEADVLAPELGQLVVAELA